MSDKNPHLHCHECGAPWIEGQKECASEYCTPHKAQMDAARALALPRPVAGREEIARIWLQATWFDGDVKAFEACGNHPEWLAALKGADALLAILTPSPSAEPVAWHVKDSMGFVMLTRDEPIADDIALTRGGIKTPLYATPPVSDAADARKAAIKECYEIAKPWPGFWPQDDATEIDKAIIKVRNDIAEKIFALTPSFDPQKCPECGSENVSRYSNNGIDCNKCGHMGRAQDFGAKCSCEKPHPTPVWHCAVHGEVAVND